MEQAHKHKKGVSLEKYDKVCREIQSLKADAILLESNLRAEIAELRRERDEALNAAKWLKQDLDRIQNERTSAALEAKLKDSLAVINILYRELQAVGWTSNSPLDPGRVQALVDEAKSSARRGDGHVDLGQSSTGTGSSRTAPKLPPSPVQSIHGPPTPPGAEMPLSPSMESFYQKDDRNSPGYRAEDMGYDSSMEHVLPGARETEDRNKIANEARGNLESDDSENPGTNGHAPVTLSSPLSMASSSSGVSFWRSFRPEKRGWVYWGKPPGCTKYSSESLDLAYLAEQLDLSEEQSSSIESMVPSGLNLNLYVCNISQDPTQSTTCIFLHRPMFYTPPSSDPPVTYCLSWAYDTQHQKNLIHLHQWTRKWANGKRPIIHLFTCPGRGQPWYYVGATKWKIEERGLTYVPGSDMDDEPRKLLIDELCDISQGNFDKRMIMGGFNSGQLKQLAIELTSASEKYRKTFARTYGLM